MGRGATVSGHNVAKRCDSRRISPGPHVLCYGRRATLISTRLVGLFWLCSAPRGAASSTWNHGLPRAISMCRLIGNKTRQGYALRSILKLAGYSFSET